MEISMPYWILLFFDLTPLEYLFQVNSQTSCNDAEVNFQVNLVVTSPECPEGESCRNSLEPLTVVLKPRANFEFAQTICVGEEIDFDNLSCFAETYHWDFGDGSTSTVEEPTHIYASEGIYQVRLRAENECGEDEITKSIQVIGLPEADADMDLDPASGCADVTVSFDNTVDDFANFSSIEWTIDSSSGWYFFDTTFTENTWDNKIVFTEAGIYEITFEVTNICGEDSWTEEIEVFEQPTAVLGSPGSFCIEEPGDLIEIDFGDFLFVNGSTCGFEWEITNTTTGEMVTTTEEFPAYSFDFGDAGNYEVSLRIDGCGCDDIERMTNFFIQTPAAITFDPVPSPICSNDSIIQLSATPGGGVWSGSSAVNAIGQFDPTQASIGISTLTYSVGVGVCQSQAQMDVEVLEFPSIEIEPIDPECDALLLDPDVEIDGVFNSETWTILFEDGTVQMIPPGSTYLVDIPGNHQFVAEVSGICGSIADTIPIEVQILDDIVISPPVNNPICSNDAPFQLVATPAGGTWSGSVAVSPDGLFSPALVNGSVTLTYSIGSGVCMASQELDLTVLEFPSVLIEPIEPECDDLSTMPEVQTAGAFTTETWTILLENGTSTTIPPGSVLTITEPGNHQFTVLLDGPCGAVSSTIPVEIQSLEAIQIAPPANIPLCSDDAPFQLIATPAGGTWSGSSAVSADGLFSPGEASFGSITLTYSIGSGVCFASSDLVLEVFEAPDLFIETIDPLCDAINMVPFVQTDGTFDAEIWTVILEDGTVISLNPGDLISISEPGNHQFTVVLNGLCGSVSNTIPIEIQSIDDIVIAPILDPICSTSSPYQLMATPTGGIWSGQGVSANGLFDPSIPSPGSTVQLTYSYGQGVCSDEASISITVIESAEVTVETGLVLCTDAEPYLLDANPSGGVWNGVGVAPDGTFDPAGLAIGTYDLIYEFQDPNGCPITRESEVRIEALPEIEVDATLTFCETSEDIALMNQVQTLDLTPSWGTLTWSGLGIVNSLTGTFNSLQAGASGEGTYTIYLDYMLIDCVVRDSIIIDIIPAPVAEAGVNDSLCITDQVYFLSGSPTNGFWSEIGGNGQGLNTSTGELDLVEAGGGTHVYQYVFGAGTSCEVSDQVTIEIIDLTGVQAGPDLEICEGTPPFSLDGMSPSMGLWSGPGITDPSGVFDPTALAPGETYTLTYCISDNTIACTACDERTIRIKALPDPIFEVVGTNCVGESIDLSNLSQNACSYQWDFGNGQGSTTQNPTTVYNAIGNYTIQLIATSCEACVDSFSLPITVTEPPEAMFTPDLKEGCAVLDVAITNQSSNFNFLEWDFGNGVTSTIIDPDVISFEQSTIDTTYLIALSVTNDCGTEFAYDSITVFPLPIVIFGTNVDEGCSPLEIELANLSVGNPDAFSWYIDGQFVSNDSILTNQVFTTSDTAITEYTITLISDNFCGSDTLNELITVFPPDVDAFFSIDTTSGCEPLTVQLNNFSTPGASIQYDFGDGNSSTDNNPTYTFDTSGVFTIIQYATGCGTDVDSIEIEVYPAPAVDFTFPSFVCLGQEITFTNTSFDLSGSEWDFGDGNSSTLNSPTHIYQTSGIFTVTLTGFSDAFECPSSISYEVEVKGNPLISFLPSVENGCVPLTIDFQNTSQGAISFSWDFGDGNTSNQVAPSHTFTQPGLYEVTLFGVDGFNCFADTNIVNIIVHDIPEANFETADDSYCSFADSIQVDNLSVDAVEYLWTFNGGTNSNQFEPAWVPQFVGAETIQLIAENTFGCRDTFLQEVEILETPVAFSPLSNFAGCAPLSVSFANASDFSDSYQWIFGENNNTSSDFEPVYTYLEDGTFEALLIASNSNGCPSDTAAFNIEVYPVPTSAFSLEEQEQCGFTDTIQPQNQSSGAIDFQWAFGNGQETDLFEPSILYQDTGTYLIQLIAESDRMCRDTFGQLMTILGSPEANIELPISTACQPAVMDLVNASQYYTSFEWDFGNGEVSSTQNNPQIYYTEDGVYEVILQVFNSNGCPSDRDTVELEIFPKPTSNFTIGDTLYCGVPDTICLDNLSIGANDYFWDFGNGLTSTNINPCVFYNAPGLYPIELTVQNQFSCRDTMLQLVRMNAQPEAALEESSFIECEPGSISFANVNNEFITSWLWDFGDGQFSEEANPTHIYSEPGLYEVQLILGSNDLCFDTLLINNAVTILPSPLADFDIQDLGDGQIQFENLSVDALFYDWDFGNGDFSEEFEPFYEYQANGNWQVILTATHQDGCTDQDTLAFMPDIFFGLHLPNAMSPENGIGDVRLFKPVGIGIQSYTVQVFSPFGQLVWENSELEGEQPKGSWDGSFNGKIVPQGAYAWKATVEYINGIKQVKTGTVSVLR